MLIRVECPECGTEHNLQESLRGQKVGCTNRLCRHVFVVPGAEPTPTTPGTPTPTPTPTPAESSWKDAPPPVQVPTPTATPTPTPTPTPTATPRKSSTRNSSHPGKKKTSTPTPAATSTSTPATPPAPPASTAPAPKPKPGRWAFRVVAVLLLGVTGVLGGVGYWVYTVFTQTEEKLARDADEAYRSGNYAKAATDYATVAAKFPGSTKADEYRLLEKLCQTLAALDNTAVQLDLSLMEVERYLKSKEGRDKVVAGRYPDLGKGVVRRIDEFVGRVVPATDASPLPHVEKAEQAITQLQRLNPPALTESQVKELREKLGKVVASVQQWEKRQDVDRRLADLETVDLPPAQKLRMLQALLTAEATTFPNLGSEAGLRSLRERLFQKVGSVVAYAQAPPDAGTVEVKAETTHNLWVQARLKEPGKEDLRPTDDVVLAVARGVLYALRQADGVVVWARRVGIDTTALPVRVRGNEASPERILVLSADKALLTALDVQGRTLWQHDLGRACLGRPVIVQDRAYLVTVEGQVREIELARGLLKGTFELGRSVSFGGVREKGTTRLYFAADDSCVFVLDVAQDQDAPPGDAGEQKPRRRPRCVGVLHTGHPAGALRAAPVLLPGETPDMPGYLVLPLATSLKETGLRVFQMPHLASHPGGSGRKLEQMPSDGRDFWLLNEGEGERLQGTWPADAATRPDVRLNGWTWFPPVVDAEKMAFVTEKGELVLVGINQKPGRDPLLFPLLPAAPVEDGPPRRNQVVRVRGEDLWVLSGGQLRRKKRVWWDREGPKLIDEWQGDLKHLDLGDPVHLCQVLPDSRYTADLLAAELGDGGSNPEVVEGRAILVTTTQARDRSAIIVSAIEDGTGKLLWQTQLGLVAATEPVRLRSAAGPETFVLMDQAGALHQVPTAPAAEQPWQGVGTKLADNLADNPRWKPQLLALPDGRTAVQVAAPGDGTKLLLRRVHWDANADRWQVTAHEIVLKGHRLAGLPALVGDHLVLPLDDGVLYRLPMPPGTTPDLQDGPNWRHQYRGPEAVGLILPLGGDRFAHGDGDQALVVREWTTKDMFKKLSEYRLTHAPAGTPLVLPADADRPARVVLADQGKRLLCLEASAAGLLAPRLARDLPGKPTDGPYVATPAGEPVRLCVILDEQTPYWFDPATDKGTPLKANDPGEMIVGRPNRPDGVVLVATEAGRVRLLDPAGEKPSAVLVDLSREGSIAPAATPVPIGNAARPDSYLLPLSDGTLMLVPAP